MRCFVVPEGAVKAVQNSYAEIIAIHAALCPNNKIVYFSGDQHDPGQFAHASFDHARQFDCSTFAITPGTPAAGITDLFCCGHAFLPNGHLLIAGGTLRFANFLGAPEAWICDAATSSFQSVAPMQHGRWYPTLLTLGNGRILAVSGINEDPNNTDQNRDLETFNAANWSVEGILSYGMETLYPRMHLLPNGCTFFVTPMNGQCMSWRIGQATPTPVCASPFPTGLGFSAYSSILLPLLPEEDYAPRVMVANLSQPLVIDLSVPSPAWANTGARTLPPAATNNTPQRFNGTLTLLPTGEVLSSGGEETYDELHPVLALEVYRAATNSWVVLPSNTSVARMYHSTALLMPDGRVWFAGSDKRCDWSFHNSQDYQGQPEPTDLQEITPSGPVDNRELRIEIFEPWYYSRPDRPTISVAVQGISIGRSFTFTSQQAASLSRVALVRAGSSTHAFNADQRYVGVPFSVNGNTVNVTLPDNENLLPPGPYLLFSLAQVVDGQTGAILDVPSVGHWITVHNGKVFKEIKPEIEVLKEEFENLHKISEADGDPFRNVVDPELIKTIAVSIDNLGRVVSGARAFITPTERPILQSVSRAALAAVAIHPLDKDMLAAQRKMEGMLPSAYDAESKKDKGHVTVHTKKSKHDG